ncbi:ABC transporter permease [Pseudonocardia nigra]|uniref:ABC transporter permease n=1 Tax=Pseudonocardia nigra TaxID=1921578 RepID=UPI001C5F7296|nr:ABC transporter permease [Pseudonocardia nigra]
MLDVLAAEWLKLRSVRSTAVAVGAALGGVLLAAGLAWAAADAYDDAPPPLRATARLAELEEALFLLPQLALGVLGVLAITSEYATGLIRTSLALVPRRWPVLAAKSVVVGGTALATGQIAVFGMYAVARAIVGDRYGGIYAAPVPDEVPLLVVTGLSAAVFALLGLGLGAIVRSTAAAVGLLVGFLHVLPIAAHNLPEPWNERVGSLMIGGLPRQIVGADLSATVYGALLSSPGAAVLFAAYALVPLGVGLWLIRGRDV